MPLMSPVVEKLIRPTVLAVLRDHERFSNVDRFFPRKPSDSGRQARRVRDPCVFRFPSIRLAAAPCYRDSAALRGLDHLWIEVERA